MVEPASRPIPARAVRMVWQARVALCCGPAVRDRAGYAYMAACGMLARLASGTARRSESGAGSNRNRATEDNVMTGTKPAKETMPSAIVANDPDDLKGTLKNLGGSRSDNWNSILLNQTINTLWLKLSDGETREKQFSATLAALIGIGPKDEMEAMMAAQLIAAHNAAMECYRRAMLGEQTFEGRRENLAQANKLSRTYATLLEALNKHRGKGQQKVTVEHVHVHAGGQAVVGTIEGPGGWGSQQNGGSTPCKVNCPCTAARDAARGRGTGAGAGRRRWRTAAAGCTATCRRARPRVIGTPSGTGATRPRRLPAGARSPPSFARCVLWQMRLRRGIKSLGAVGVPSRTGAHGENFLGRFV